MSAKKAKAAAATANRPDGRKSSSPKPGSRSNGSERPVDARAKRSVDGAKATKRRSKARSKAGRALTDDMIITADELRIAAEQAEQRILRPGPVQRPERLDAGKALRQTVPRAWHTAWEPGPDRRDPIAILEEQAETRLPDLIPIRHGRMASSPFAFFRGRGRGDGGRPRHHPEHRHPGAGLR